MHTFARSVDVLQSFSVAGCLERVRLVSVELPKKRLQTEVLTYS